MENTTDIPQEWKDALNKLYLEYSTNPTTQQKINILISMFGDCCLSYNGDPEVYDNLKMSVLELEYLESIGLYKPNLF